MRSRNIKPSLFKNEILGTEDPLLTIIFQGLWCAADREGLVEDRPLRLKAEILPYRENIDFNGYLTALSRLGFIRRYEAGGTKVIEVIKFKKHQNPHKTEKASTLPKYQAESEGCRLTVKTPLSDGELTEPARLIPDPLLLIPDSLIPEKQIDAPQAALCVNDQQRASKAVKEKFDPLSFRPQFVPEDLWAAFLDNRKFKRLQNSKLALTTVCNELRIAVDQGHPVEECIRTYVSGGMQRFKAEWMGQKNGNGQKSKTRPESQKAKDARELVEALRRAPDGQSDIKAIAN